MIPAKIGPFRSSRFNVIAIFVNFNWRPAAILDFAKFHFWPKNNLRVLNEPWVKIWWQSVKPFPSYCVFSVFQNGGRRPSWILKFKLLMKFSYWGSIENDSCQIWSISDMLFQRYCHICKFPSEAGGHLGFCKISILTPKSFLGLREEPWTKIWW